MNYENTFVDRLHFFRWTAEPTVADVDALERDVLGAASRAGGKLVQLVVLHVHSVPTPEVRERTGAYLRTIDAHTELAILVVEGSGMDAIFVRTAVRGLLILTRQTMKSKIVASVDEGIRLAASVLGVRASELEKRLRARGALSDLGRSA